MEKLFLFPQRQAVETLVFMNLPANPSNPRLDDPGPRAGQRQTGQDGSAHGALYPLSCKEGVGGRRAAGGVGGREENVEESTASESGWTALCFQNVSLFSAIPRLMIHTQTLTKGFHEQKPQG